ncbi:hypothetical protein CHT99_17230 [Sphingobacterium cellulitidis]|nr:hypothetical protein CHT99_17230 [Sphingobacterium cellulitidis]
MEFIGPLLCKRSNDTIIGGFKFRGNLRTIKTINNINMASGSALLDYHYPHHITEQQNQRA